ncbi:hypothetical protein ABZ816_31590 [Actinosynnema sp. NPDC047251]|nr:hypothetical protein [Saccharothrix espanaensis]
MDTWIARSVRRALPGNNPLARPGDRVEGTLLVATAAVVLLSLPVAAAIGSEVRVTSGAGTAVLVGLGVWAGASGVMVLACLLVRSTHNRIRARHWEQDWKAFEPVWRKSA